jgi:ferredoxin-nitrite reductase
MQRRMLYLRRSEDEEIKEAGLKIDFDEIARRGSMSKEEKNIAKWYGVYGSKHPGNHMARVVIPGGVITSTQARNIAEVAEKYGQGRLNITTRQAIQFHWLKVEALADMMRDLAQEGSTTKHGCGDVTRNIAACPLAETCKYARFDVRSYALKTAKYLGDAHDLENLPEEIQNHLLRMRRWLRSTFYELFRSHRRGQGRSRRQPPKRLPGDHWRWDGLEGLCGSGAF